MRADTEGWVSAPTRVVSMGGNNSSVVAFEENLSRVDLSILVDELCKETSVVESLWCLASCSSSSDGSPTGVHLSMKMTSIVVGRNGEAKVCGKDGEEEKEKEEKKISDDSSTTDSLVDSSKGHLAQTHSVPCNRVTVGMGEVSGFEDYHKEGVAGAFPWCTEVDQLAPVHAYEEAEVDSFANTTARATRDNIG